MKLHSKNHLVLREGRRIAGVMLTEVLVYLAVFAILTSIAFAAFYLCWDHTRALVATTDDITAAVHAGERWRADIRSATGKITVEMLTNGEQVRIPQKNGEVVYRYQNGGLWRKLASSPSEQRVFEKVKASQMRSELRNGVTAWRWELELPLRRSQTQLPLLFTFEAAQKS